MRDHLLAIDQGTSSSRALVFDASGRVVGMGQRTFDQSFPADGWVEQDPETLWQTTLAAGRAALGAAGVSAGDIAAIGITNQRETTLVWDAVTSEPVYPAIVWQDRRTAQRCGEIVADGFEPTLTEITGLVADPYFSSTKLVWILEREGIRKRAESGSLRFGTVDSFLVWRMTQGRSHRTDATNASRTQLYDLEKHEWSAELLDYFGVPRAMLPEVDDCVAEFGVCDAEWFGAEIPILGIAGDQQAALVGQACFEPGMTKCTFGTGCFVVTNTGTQRPRSPERLLATVGYRLDGSTRFALEGSVFSAGVAIKWLQDSLGLIDSPAATERAVDRTGGETRGVYVVPAFTGLGAPHWRPDARGLITGLTLDDGSDEIVVATLKSVAFQAADLIDAVGHDGTPVETLRVDGGMVVNDWFCQFVADALDVTVERPRVTETTAVGAATLAALGAGLIGGLDEAAQRWGLEARFERTVSDRDREGWLVGWRHAVDRATR